MIRTPAARRLTGLAVLFAGLLVAFSALSLAALGRPGPAVTATVGGLAVCALGVWWLWRLPPVVPDEEPGPDATR